MDRKEHWEQVFQTKKPESVSWYQPHLLKSFELIKKANPDRDAAIIDVGAGESTLVDDLLVSGYKNLTVLDISQTAIDALKMRLKENSSSITWLVDSITCAQLPVQQFDVWHDRAVFHFLTNPADRIQYVQQVGKAVKPGGHVIVATFGPEGPEKCSGLTTMRYDADSLHTEFGARFNLVESAIELHQTPFGTTQQFVYCFCKLIGS